MTKNERDPRADAQEKQRDDDLNREDIMPGESDTESERGYHGERKPTDPDSALSDVDRDDTVDD